MKKWLKKIVNDWYSIIITIATTLIVRNVVTIADINNGIANHSLKVSDWFLFILCQIIIVVLSFLIAWITSSLGKYLYRYKIRKKYLNPLAETTVFNKRIQIEEKLKRSETYLNLFQSTEVWTKEKLYYYKQLMHSIDENLRDLLNLINYKDKCITNIDELPTKNKLSMLDIIFYIKKIDAAIIEATKDDDSLKKYSSYVEKYESDEIAFIVGEYVKLQDELETLKKQLNLE